MSQKKSKKQRFGAPKHKNAGKSPTGRSSAFERSSNRHAGTARALPAAALSAKKGLVLYGLHSVMAALQNPERQIKAIFATAQQAEKLADSPQNIAACHRHLLDEIHILDKEQISFLCQTGADMDSVHQGLAIHADPLEEMFLSDILLHVDTATNADEPVLGTRLLVLDQVTDPRNVGAILRSARAFGVSAIILTRKHAPQETASLAKAAAGALEYVPLVRVVNLARALDEMKEAGFILAGLDASATDTLEGLAQIPHLALIMGAEATGMRRLTRQACDRLVAIPMLSDTESLNVSVAAAIALYASRQK